MVPVVAPARKRSRAQRGPAVLAAMIRGASLTEIAQIHGISHKQVEKAVRDELRKRWIAPAQEYARLQIARLEHLVVKLNEGMKEGDLATIDRFLKIMDRLDRYHGFTKLAALTRVLKEDTRPQLIKLMDQAAISAEQKA